jgi:hypothetical protein
MGDLSNVMKSNCKRASHYELTNALVQEAHKTLIIYITIPMIGQGIS